MLIDAHDTSKKGSFSLALEFLKRSGRPVNTCIERIVEGFETLSFKSEFRLGYKSDYSSSSGSDQSSFIPRLFHSSLNLGSFQVNEVVNFDQSDLIDEDVFILGMYMTNEIDDHDYYLTMTIT